MMAILIFISSLLTLLMFFVTYCRSLTASSKEAPLTDEVQDLTGIKSRASGRDYQRITQILQLCPDRPEDRVGLRIIGAYYGLLNLLDQSVSKLSPAVGTWAEEERAGCAHFAAVALGRRIALNREMLAQQAEL
ncbi:MAG TPA: hypothetical protein VL128_08845 [Candidatus Eisenbacteria bacterium]|nr:hypothetical protein [Candidatus Eisenbacteria bacterium]